MIVLNKKNGHRMSTLAISYALMCFDLVWCCCLGLFAGHDVETKLRTHQRSAIHLEFSVVTYMKINPFKGFHIQRARIFQEIPNVHFDVVSAKSSCCNRKQPVRRINQQTWRAEANTHGQPHCTGPEDLSSKWWEMDAMTFVSASQTNTKSPIVMRIYG